MVLIPEDAVRLTETQFDVLTLLESGLTYKQIAATLGVTYRTVLVRLRGARTRNNIPTNYNLLARRLRFGYLIS
jgi:DNA-binding CsgD family transcriptional regulator